MYSTEEADHTLLIVPGGGGMRGAMMRGGRGSGRGMRGGHSGGKRGGSSANTTGAAQNPSGTNVETLYEDVYEPAGYAGAAVYLNGSNTAATSSYFEEFPEPSMSSTAEAGIPGFQRQNPSKNNRVKNQVPNSTNTAASVVQHQKAH